MADEVLDLIKLNKETLFENVFFNIKNLVLEIKKTKLSRQHTLILLSELKNICKLLNYNKLNQIILLNLENLKITIIKIKNLILKYKNCIIRYLNTKIFYNDFSKLVMELETIRFVIQFEINHNTINIIPGSTPECKMACYPLRDTSDYKYNLCMMENCNGIPKYKLVSNITGYNAIYKICKDCGEKIDLSYWNCDYFIFIL